MRFRVTKAIAAVMILACCASMQAKKSKDDSLTHRTFNAPVGSVYAAAVKVAGRQWQVTASDPAAHTLSFDTVNTREEVAGGYSTFSVSVACAAAADGATAVRMDVTEHASSKPSIAAIVYKSQRRADVVRDFWGGIETALKAAEAAAPEAETSPAPAPENAQADTPAGTEPAPPSDTSPAVASAPASAAENTPQPAGAEAAPEQSSGAPADDSNASAAALAAVTIQSRPAGAEIKIEGKFFGDTPTTVRLPAGDYTISVSKSGYRPWKRTVTLTAGGSVTLNAALEK